MEQEWRQNSVIMEPVPVKPRADEADREGNTRSDEEENFVRLRSWVSRRQKNVIRDMKRGGVL
jgi:hypothetical protein